MKRWKSCVRAEKTPGRQNHSKSLMPRTEPDGIFHGITSMFDLWKRSFSSRHSGVETMIKYGLKSDPFLITELAIFEEQST